ncbi:MAG: hypothetical protein ACI9P5_000876 [Saprospiraceae bacterium]|jgi:hypothetical protein
MLLFVAALFMTSCEDEPGGSTDTAPSITLLSEANLTLAPTEEFTVEISASKGTNEMNGVYVFEDGIRVPEARLKYNGVTSSANPALLAGDDRQSLTWSVSIIAQATAGTSSNFEVEVRDNSATALRKSVTVTVATASTPPTLTGLGNQSPTYAEGTQNVSFKVNGEKGSGLLSTLEVRRNSVKVDVADFNWNGLSMMTMGNPFQLTGTDVDGFTEGEFLVDLPMEVGVSVYDFILEDEFGSRDTASYVVTTTVAGTPIESREDVLLNAAGPGATGGLDLDTGMSTTSGSTAAEIRDNGIDTDLAIAINWRQTISPVNGTTMKYVVAGQEGVPEGYTFDGVEVKEDLAGLYNANTGEVIDGTKSSSVMEVGDTFIVQKGSQYWLITAKEVNVRATDNTDNYLFDVKY